MVHSYFFGGNLGGFVFFEFGEHFVDVVFFQIGKDFVNYVGYVVFYIGIGDGGGEFG